MISPFQLAARRSAADPRSLPPPLAGLAHPGNGAPLGPDDIAAAVLDGIDRREELILPDAAARAAYALKVGDRPAYDERLRRQAARLHELDRPE